MYVDGLTQIVDSVARLQELMDIQLQEGRGPAEILRTFREQRERESHERGDDFMLGDLMNISVPHALFD